MLSVPPFHIRRHCREQFVIRSLGVLVEGLIEGPCHCARGFTIDLGISRCLIVHTTREKNDRCVGRRKRARIGLLFVFLVFLVFLDGFVLLVFLVFLVFLVLLVLLVRSE